MASITSKYKYTLFEGNPTIYTRPSGKDKATFLNNSLKVNKSKFKQFATQQHPRVYKHHDFCTNCTQQQACNIDTLIYIPSFSNKVSNFLCM